MELARNYGRHQVKLFDTGIDIDSSGGKGVKSAHQKIVQWFYVIACALSMPFATELAHCVTAKNMS